MKSNRQLPSFVLFLVAQIAGGAIAAENPKSETVTLTWRPADSMSLYIGLGDHRVRFTNVVLKTATIAPDIADVEVTSENELTLHGKSNGDAIMGITDRNGKTLNVSVAVLDYSLLQATLRVIDPRIEFKHRFVDGAEQIVLFGSVEKPETIFKAYRAGNIFMDDRGINYETNNGSNPVPVRNGSGLMLNYDDPACKIGKSNFISDGRRVLSMLTVRTSQK